MDLWNGSHFDVFDGARLEFLDCLILHESWLGNLLGAMALYIPTKCQIFREGGRATDSAGDCCKELTLSKLMSILVYFTRSKCRKNFNAYPRRDADRGRIIKAGKNGK